MNDTFIVSQWAFIRLNELVDIPDTFSIHPDFLKTLSHEEFAEAFREIGAMFRQMYTDMAKKPEHFGLPLYKTEEYGYFTNQAREARKAPWYLGYFLLTLFAWGDFQGRAFRANTTQIRKVNPARKPNILLSVLSDYRFIFSGLKKGSLSSGDYLEIDYPDNRNVLSVLSVVAKKVRETQLRDAKNVYSPDIAFENAFISWNYKILAEDLHTCSLGKDCGYVADKMHQDAHREVVLALDKILTEQGYTREKAAFNEGPSLRYYRGSSKTYAYALTSDKGQLYLEMRIRNAHKCLPYLQECPERIAEIFRHSDTGCQNRINETCKYGVKYTFEGEEKWHCGCCGAPFKIHPVAADIPHYLKLMECGG